jgi:hypothetical protein
MTCISFLWKNEGANIVQELIPLKRLEMGDSRTVKRGTYMRYAVFGSEPGAILPHDALSSRAISQINPLE